MDLFEKVQMLAFINISMPTWSSYGSFKCCFDIQSLIPRSTGLGRVLEELLSLQKASSVFLTCSKGEPVAYSLHIMLRQDQITSQGLKRQHSKINYFVLLWITNARNG